jgi:hypothetical protein
MRKLRVFEQTTNWLLIGNHFATSGQYQVAIRIVSVDNY